MATSSGLYNDRIKDIMNDRSGTEDRARAYKESVEVKQTKNKLDRLDESTRVFQAQLLKSTLNSEEHLKHIAKHTKIMAKETMLSQILTLAKYTWFAYKILKVFKPQFLANTINRFENFLKRSGFGAKGMQQQCCCDSHGMSGRMGRRSRRMERRTRTSNTSYEAARQSSERMDRSRRASMDRAERIRRNAEDLRQRKVSQVQAKHVQDALNKNMKRWTHSAHGSIKGIFDSSGAGLRTASKTLGKAAASSSSNLIKVGLGAVAGITTMMTGLFTSVLGIAGRGAAAIGRGGMALGRGAMGMGAAGLGFARANPGLFARGTGALAGGYAAHRFMAFDPKNDFGTSRYINQSGLGDQYIGRSGSALSGLLRGITFGAIDLDRFVGSSGNSLNEAYFKKHGKYLGAPTNFAQYLQESDDTIGRLFGMERGVISTGGNYIGSQIGSGWRQIKGYFFGIEEAIEEQTDSLSKRLDTNFKEMKLSSKEARKLTEEDKANLRKLSGIPEDQGHNIPFSPAYPRPEVPQSHVASDGPSSAFTTGAKPKTDAQTFKNLMDPTTILTGATVRSSGWSQHDATGYSEPTPVGFTGTSGGINQVLSTKATKYNVGDVNKSYEGASRDELIKGTYDAFRSAGFSHEGSLALVGEVGRENSFNPNHVFGSHTDPYNKAVNAGFISWQGSRGTKLQKYLGEQGLLDSNGQIVKSQAALNAQARFLRKEMESGVGRRGNNNADLAAYLSGSNVDPTVAMDRLGKDYIQWRIDDPKYRSGGIANRTAFYNQGAKLAGDGTQTGGQVPGYLTALMNPDQIGLSTKFAGIPGGSSSQIAIDMNNRGTRNQDITPELKNILQYAAGQSGVNRISVTSGGQDPASKKGARRVGRSKNHDHGNAADFDMFVTNPDGTERQLRYSSAEDRKIIEAFTEHAFKAGATNVGIGPGYMGDGRMHLGNTGADGRVWGHTMEKSSAESNIVAAANRGRSQRTGFDLASALNSSPGMAPIPVEIASISRKTHEDNVAHYSQSSGLGAIFGVNRAAASELPEHMRGSQASIKGDRLGSGMYQNSSTGAFIEDRISQAHVAAETIRPNISPENSVINASQGITIPPSADFSQNVPTVNTPKPVDPVTERMNPSTVNHYADPELMYPLLYHHMGN